MTHLSLMEQAKLQATLSEKLCLAACRDYHTSWPLLRAAGMVGGVDADRHPLLEFLNPLLSQKKNLNILIAGCADAALLSLVTEIAHCTSNITVVDRCDTPLAMCRHVVASEVQLTTCQADLLTYTPDTPFDVIVCHSLLPFFSDTDRFAVLRRFSQWLAPKGHLVLAVRLINKLAALENTSIKSKHWIETRAAEAYAALVTSHSIDNKVFPQLSSQLQGFYQTMASRNLAYTCAQDAIDEFLLNGLTVRSVLAGGEGLGFMTQPKVLGLVVLATAS